MSYSVTARGTNVYPPKMLSRKFLFLHLLYIFKCPSCDRGSKHKAYLNLTSTLFPQSSYILFQLDILTMKTIVLQDFDTFTSNEHTYDSKISKYHIQS